jgi:hypothetical protein
MGAWWRSVSNMAPGMLAAFAVVAFLGTGARDAFSQQDAAALEHPKGHFKVERPANLTSDIAETVYRNIRGEMAAGYALARMPGIRDYPSWRRFNIVPYRSATHGARYVNNYANELGKTYGTFEKAGTLPRGAVLVKDSFTATADGDIYPGPMFVMEKMEAGFNPAGGDWRYSMIMPDGSLFGETGGDNSESVQFCNGCHAERREYDYLYFLPEAVRASPAETSQ